jgi:hypothetical protein
MRYFFIYIVVVLSITLSGCASNQINTDSSRFYPYKTIVDTTDIYYRLPPGGQLYGQPKKFIDLDEEGEKFRTIFFVGYDDPSVYVERPVNSRIWFGLQKVNKSLGDNVASPEFAETVIESFGTDDLQGHKIVFKANRTWLELSLIDNRGLSYVIPFNDDYCLVFQGNFSSKKLRNNPEWLQKRTLALEKIMETIYIYRQSNSK